MEKPEYWLEELLTDRLRIKSLPKPIQQAWSRQKFFKLNKPVFSHYAPHGGDLASESQMELMLQNFWDRANNLSRRSEGCLAPHSVTANPSSTRADRNSAC
jgi:hypothetical protein